MRLGYVLGTKNKINPKYLEMLIFNWVSMKKIKAYQYNVFLNSQFFMS